MMSAGTALNKVMSLDKYLCQPRYAIQHKPCFRNVYRLGFYRCGQSRGQVSEPDSFEAHSAIACRKCLHRLSCCFSMAVRAGQASAWPVPSDAGF